MRKIPVDEALSGMELAEPALAPDGRVLLRAGAPLSDGALAALRRAGVSLLSIKDGESEEEAILAAVARLEARFAAASSEDAMMRALRDAVEERLRAGWLE